MLTRAAALLGNPLRPTWSWDFARTGRLPPGATFTRASSGWYFNSAGVLVSAASNVARFDNDPATGQPLGYLAEMASTNNTPWSTGFSHWSATNVTGTTDGTCGPDSVTLADKITSSVGNANHFANAASTAQGAGNVIGMSAFVKQGTQRYVALVFSGDGPWHSVTFDFNTGTYLGSGTNATALPARQLANGWWRIAASWIPTNNVGGVGVGPARSAADGTVNDISYSAAGTETVYTTGWQVDTTGVGVTSYIPTAGSTVARVQDILLLPLTSLPGWSASQGGTLVAAYRLYAPMPISPGYSQTPIALNSGSYVNSVNLIARLATTGTSYGYVVSGGVDQAFLNTGSTPEMFTRYRQSLGWGTARVAEAVGGAAIVGVSGALLLPVAPTRLELGSYGNQGLNGVLESVAYYRGARPDAFVQAVSR